MAKERRQFLTVGTVAGAGLPREVLVDESTGRIYCATASQPAGVGQALQSELLTEESNRVSADAYLQHQIDSLTPGGEGHWSHYRITIDFNTSDWIHIDNHPTLSNSQKQDIKSKGYYYFTSVGVNKFGSEDVNSDSDYYLEVLDDNDLSYIPMFGLMKHNGNYVVCDVYRDAPISGQVDFVVHYGSSEDYSVADLNEIGNHVVYVKCKPVHWELNYYESGGSRPAGYYWHSLLCRQDGTQNPFGVATSSQGRTLLGTAMGIYSDVLPYESRTGYFGGWFDGQGSSLLMSDADMYLSATQNETVPPVGYYCTLYFTVNVT